MPEAEINGLPEVAGQTFTIVGSDHEERKVYGWLACMMKLGASFPNHAVNVCELLDWGMSTVVTYQDGAGNPIINATDGWYCVPMIKSNKDEMVFDALLIQPA